MQDYSEYSGHYKGKSGPIRVWLDTGLLFYDDGITAAELLPNGFDKFVIKAYADDIVLEFQRDPEGSVTGVRVVESAMEETALKVG